MVQINPMTIFANKRITTDRDVNMNSVTPEFFQTMGIRIVEERGFDGRDVRDPGGQPGLIPSFHQGYRSAIVNEAFVKRYLGGRNPLGVLVCDGDRPDAKPNIEIVGVMANISYRGLREESEQAFFRSLKVEARAARSM
jgi:hypothetical protein